MIPPTSFEAIVVGAGIVGASCAWRLSERGVHTLVIDPNPPGSVATAAGMGHIVVLDDTEDLFALTRLGRDQWEAIAPRLPASAAYVRPGTLWIAENDAEMTLLRTKYASYVRRGIRAEVLDERTLVEHEPNLKRGLLAGLLLPDDAIVHAPAVAEWMIGATVAMGGSFVTGAPVIRIDDGAVELSDGRRFTARRIVNAAGAAAPLLTPSLPIRRRKGHLILTECAPGFCRHEIIELGYLASAHGNAAESVAFNIQPRASGQVLIGSSRQYGSETPDLEPRILDLMMARARHFMPGIDALRHARAWTGFRPATPDSLPIIGAMPGRPGLFVAAGHEGLGVTTGVATGLLIAQLATGAPPSIDAAPFSPSRFPEIRS